METILDNGVTYVKATALAKKYRYTTDYIGQLCRNGKVEAKLIGRAWFVNEESLTNHKKDRYNSTRVSEIAINKSSVSDRESHTVAVRREVRPVLSKSVHRSVMQITQPKTYNFSTRTIERISKYHQDSEQLVPKTLPKDYKTIEHVPTTETSAESFKINVSLNEKSSRKLAFEQLPEITLRGELAIDSLDDPDLFKEVQPVSVQDIEFKQDALLEPVVRVARRYESLSKKESISPLITAIEPVRHKLVVDEKTIRKNIPEKHISANPVTTTKNVSWTVTLGFFLGSLLAAILVLGLTSYVESDGVIFVQSVIFSPEAVMQSVLEVANSY